MSGLSEIMHLNVDPINLIFQRKLINLVLVHREPVSVLGDLQFHFLAVHLFNAFG